MSPAGALLACPARRLGCQVRAVDLIGPRPGQVVLVAGASGGVGSYAVQLLAARGATVVATGTADDARRGQPGCPGRRGADRRQHHGGAGS